MSAAAAQVMSAENASILAQMLTPNRADVMAAQANFAASMPVMQAPGVLVASRGVEAGAEATQHQPMDTSTVWSAAAHTPQQQQQQLPKLDCHDG